MFHFKQFSVNQTGCAMKINTDGVLLGALTQADHSQSILDIGAGTGVISLMLAQRFPGATIDAVEIDTSAAKTAKTNFQNSPFTNRLHLHEGSFEQYFENNPDKKFDLIVSNPPFYINSLESPGRGRTLAKHADVRFFKKMISSIGQHLIDGGQCWLILPLQTSVLVKELAAKHQLHLQQLIHVKSYQHSAPHRELVVFGLDEAIIIESKFVIYNEPKQHSEQYRIALQDFFTIF